MSSTDGPAVDTGVPADRRTGATRDGSLDVRSRMYCSSVNMSPLSLPSAQQTYQISRRVPLPLPRKTLRPDARRHEVIRVAPSALFAAHADQRGRRPPFGHVEYEHVDKGVAPAEVAPQGPYGRLVGKVVQAPRHVGPRIPSAHERHGLVEAVLGAAGEDESRPDSSVRLGHVEASPGRAARQEDRLRRRDGS